MDAQGRVCPLPRTWYLKLVSCSTPTGPRACIRPVEMPISAPMPNSPPSANWVEALCSTMALSTSSQETLRGRGVGGDDRLGVARAVARDMLDGVRHPVDDAHRDDGVEDIRVPQSAASAAGARAHRAAQAAASPRTSQPASSSARDQGLQMAVHAGPVDQQGLGGAADPGAPHLRVEHDLARHLQVGAQRPRRRGRCPRGARSPAPARRAARARSGCGRRAARPRRRQPPRPPSSSPDRGAIAGRHHLDSFRGQSCRAQRRGQASVDRHAGSGNSRSRRAGSPRCRISGTARRRRRSRWGGSRR